MNGGEEQHAFKVSQRVVFDVRGKLFATSYESIKQVPCLLSKLADPDNKFHTRDPDGVIFIDRNSKHFAVILDIVTNCTNGDFWSIPDDIKECQELLIEVDFYSLPGDLVAAVKDKVAEKEENVQKKMENLNSQINALMKEKDSISAQLTKEIREKIELRNLVTDCQLQTSGCYISISEMPFSVRISRDLSKMHWSSSRSVERVVIKGSSMFFGANGQSSHSQTYETKPSNAQEASIVLWNNSRSYIMCERKIGNDSQTLLQFARIDLCCMGNDELLVIFENPAAHSTALKPGEHERKERAPPYHRIICRYQSDAR